MSPVASPADPHAARYGAFAASQLTKRGWAPSQGLGRDLSGIAAPVAASHKHDSRGIGSANNMAVAWWDSLYNSASAGVSVRVGSDGELAVVSAPLPAKSVDPPPVSSLYAKFVKAGATPSAAPIKAQESLSRLTDEQLLEACEGRRARVGARGLSHLDDAASSLQAAKLARLEDSAKPQPIDASDRDAKRRRKESKSRSKDDSQQQSRLSKSKSKIKDEAPVRKRKKHKKSE